MAVRTAQRATMKGIVKKIQCDENHFACSNGTGPCVNKLWVCDWEFDCFDASDESPEQGCESNACEKDEFKCGNSKCVQMAFYCDTDDDCGDMSDEPQGCVPRHTYCGGSMIQCLNASCLTQEQLCEGFTCLEYVTDISGVTCAGTTCADHHQFQRLDGICIDKSHVYNGIRDCLDGIDEGTGCMPADEPTINVSTLTTVSATMQTSNESSNIYLLVILPAVGCSLGLCLVVFVGLLCCKRTGRPCFFSSTTGQDRKNETQTGESLPMSVFTQYDDEHYATVNENMDLRKSLQNVNDDLEDTNGGKIDTNNSNTTHSDDILEQHMGKIRTDANDKLYSNQYENDQPNLQMESHSGINEYEDLGMSVQNVYDDLEKINGGKMDANNSKTTPSDDDLEQHMEEIRADANDKLYCNQYEK